MAKIPLWQLIQNNRFLRPFQVRDISGKTLLDRARILIALVILAMLGMFLVSSRWVNLLLNRDELERLENEFITQFYPAYDSLYYWLAYQGNLAREFSSVQASETAAAQFVSQIAPALDQLGSLKYIQFGRVGVNSQWQAVKSSDSWAVTSEVNQDFAAWLLTKQLSSDQIYWYNARARSDELALFWLYNDTDGEKVYFLAVLDFAYGAGLEDSQMAEQGMITFVSDTGEQQFFPLLSADASAAASTSHERGRAGIENGWSSDLVAAELEKHTVNQRQAIFQLEDGRRHFWVKLSPAYTQTDFKWLAIIKPEVELLAGIGIRSAWINWALIGMIGINVLTFLYYYLRYSRRYYFTNQIKDIIKNGESAGLEFKSSLRYDLKEKQLNKALEGAILKSVAAFNNTDGGLLIIGVSDDARVLGLQDDYSTLKKADKDGFELHLRALISQAYGEHFAARRVEIFFPVLENKEVCVVKVKKGRNALYTSVVDKNGTKLEKFYIRMGNSSREIEKLSDIVDYQNQRFKFHLPKWDKK